MKKISTFIICALLIISVSACKPLDLQQRDNSSELSSQNSRTLIRSLPYQMNILNTNGSHTTKRENC